MPSPPSASIHGENNPYQTVSPVRGDPHPTFAPPPPPPPFGQRRPVARPPHGFRPKTLGHLARSTSAEVDNEVAIALASGRSIVSKTDWKEEDAQFLVELIEKQFPKGNIVWDWVGQQMADRGFTKNQCRSKWKRIRTKALLATEYGMKIKDAEENELDDDHENEKSAQKAIMGLTKSLNDFGSVGERQSSLLFSNRYQNRTASSTERSHRASSSRPHPSNHHGRRYYPGLPHGPYDHDGEVDELWSDHDDPHPGSRSYGPPSSYPAPTRESGLDPPRHEYQHQRHYPSASPGSSRHGSLSEQGASMPRTIFDYSHEPSSTQYHPSHHHHSQHRPNVSATASASEVTVAVATSEGTGVTEEVLSEIAATPTSFGKIEWKAEDSDFLVELIQTKFKSRKVDWGWIAQQMEGRGYDKAQCKSRWWRVQHRSHNRNGSQGGYSIGTISSSRGKRASMSQSDDASIHEDDRPGTTTILEENESRQEAKPRDHRQWGSAEYDDIDMAEEPVHHPPSSRHEEATPAMSVLGKSESQRGYRGVTAAAAAAAAIAGARSIGAGPDSPQTPSGPTQKHIEWKEEDSQYMFKMIEREFPVGNIVWSVIAERMASRGYSQTQCMSKWRRHLKSMKKSADEQPGMDMDGIEEAGTAYPQQHRVAERPRGFSHPPSPPRHDNDYDAYDHHRSRKRFNGSEQFQQHAATHFQHPSPYDHSTSGRGVPSHHRSNSGYSHPIEAEYERYYDASGHRRFDSYSGDADYGRAAASQQHQHHHQQQQQQHIRYPSYGSEYAAYADEGRRRMERPRPSEYGDDRGDYEYSSRYRPPPPPHGPYAYPPRYPPGAEPERSRSMDRRRDYHHPYPQEGAGDGDRYAGHGGSASRMSATAGGMVIAANRSDYRPLNERDRHRFGNDMDSYAREEVFNPSKRAKRVQSGEYGSDDYYSSASLPYPPAPSSSYSRRDASHDYSYRRETRDHVMDGEHASPRSEHPGNRRSPLAPPVRSHDQVAEEREQSVDWQTKPKEPISSVVAPGEFSPRRRRPSHSPPPVLEQQQEHKRPQPPPLTSKQTEQDEEEEGLKGTVGEPSPRWQPMKSKEEEARLGKNKEDEEEAGQAANSSPLPPSQVETTASTPTPSVAQASHPAPSPLPASHPRPYDREQQQQQREMTPEPQLSTFGLPGPRSAARHSSDMSLATAPGPMDRSRPPPPSSSSQSARHHYREREDYGRERYYYEDEQHYRGRERTAAAAGWEREDYYYDPQHYGPPSRRGPPLTSGATTSGAAHAEHHYGHNGSSQHATYRSGPLPPSSLAGYRAEEDEEEEGYDAHRRREEWLDRGRYEMSDMQQLAAELERQGRKWDTIRREIRIPRLTSPFDDQEGRMAVDEYPSPPPPPPPPHHRGHRMSYGSYGNEPSGYLPPTRAPPQYAGTGGRGGAMGPPHRSGSSSARRRSSAAAAAGDPNGPPSSSSQSRMQPPYEPLYDRPGPASSLGATGHHRQHYSTGSDGNARLGLLPQFSYAHYGSPTSSTSGPIDQGGAAEGPHASKRGRSPDAMERDDEGFGGAMASHRNTNDPYEMVEDRVGGHAEGRPSRHEEEEEEEDRVLREHGHHSGVEPDLQVMERRGLHEKEAQGQEEGEAGLISRGDVGDEKMVASVDQGATPGLDQQAGMEGSGGGGNGEKEEPKYDSPNPNSTTTTSSSSSSSSSVRSTPLHKEQAKAGNETTTVITAGKDDSQDVETMAKDIQGE